MADLPNFACRPARQALFMKQQSPFNPDQQAADLPAKIVAGLERMSEAFKVLLWDSAKEYGLSPIQIRLLIHVAYHPAQRCTVSQLAREFNLTKPTISDAVKVLEEKGLIGKITSTADSRSYTIALSADGQAIVDKTQAFPGPMSELVARIPRDQQEKFFEVLSTLIYGLNRHGVLNVQRSCFSCRFYDKKPMGDYCLLLQKTLFPADIRIDCPEYEERVLS